jgi:hypothetical protein
MAKMWDWIIPGSGADIATGHKVALLGNKTFAVNYDAVIVDIPASGSATAYLNRLTLEYVYGPGPIANASGKWETWGR